jgi:hypothetical protein
MATDQIGVALCPRGAIWYTQRRYPISHSRASADPAGAIGALSSTRGAGGLIELLLPVALSPRGNFQASIGRAKLARAASAAATPVM